MLLCQSWSSVGLKCLFLLLKWIFQDVGRVLVFVFQLSHRLCCSLQMIITDDNQTLIRLWNKAAQSRCPRSIFNLKLRLTRWKWNLLSIIILTCWIIPRNPSNYSLIIPPMGSHDPDSADTAVPSRDRESCSHPLSCFHQHELVHQIKV